jgi:hypothetical protein
MSFSVRWTFPSAQRVRCLGLAGPSARDVVIPIRFGVDAYEIGEAARTEQQDTRQKKGLFHNSSRASQNGWSDAQGCHVTSELDEGITFRQAGLEGAGFDKSARVTCEMEI